MSEVTTPHDYAYAQAYMPMLIALHLTIKLATMSQRLIETIAAPLDTNSLSAARFIAQLRSLRRLETCRYERKVHECGCIIE